VNWTPWTRTKIKEPSKQGDSLVGIVTVVYGVTLATALTKNSDVLLHPLDPRHQLSALLLLSVAILSAYAFFTYVMTVSDSPWCYDVVWTKTNAKPRGLLQFGSDLVLAVLYIRLLFDAATVSETGARTSHANLRSLFFSLTVLMFWVIVVRLLRYGAIWKIQRISLLPLGFAIAAFILGCCSGPMASRQRDLRLATILLVAVLIYVVINDKWSYGVARATAPTDEEAGAMVEGHRSSGR
jgi:hypothetical protein